MSLTVVLCTFGNRPSGETAVTRARTLAGRRGTVLVVPATRAALATLPPPRRTEPPVRPVDASGAEGLRQALAAAPPGPVLLLHDDVLLTSAGLRALAACHERHPRLVVAHSNDRGTDHFAGALPPVASARPAIADLARELADREHPVYRVRPVCLYGDRDDLLGLVPHHLTYPETVLSLASETATVAAGAVAAHDGTCGRQLAPPEGADGRPLLVASLIVRDEAAMLADCLASLDGVVDRIEVCDTGSTDATVAIAEAAGARVIHRPWRDDFAWARNEALQQCQDAWYVLQIDADERLDCPDPDLLRWRLATGIDEHRGFTVELANVGSGHRGSTSRTRALRVFRPEEVRFVGALHETAEALPELPAASWSALDGVTIRHLGYASDLVEERGKGQRNLDIARRAYESDPSPATAVDYARSLAAAGSDPDTERRLLDEILTAATSLPDAGRAYLLARRAAHCLADGDAERALALSERALELVPADDAAADVFGRAALALGDPTAVLEMAERRRAAPPRRQAFEDPAAEARASSRVVAAYALLGQASEACDLAIRVLESAAEHFDAWVELTAALGVTDPEGAIERLVDLTLHAGVGAFRPLADALPGSLTADVCARYRERGGSDRQAVEIGLATALVAGNDRAAWRLLPHAHHAEPDALAVLAARAHQRGDTDLARRLRDVTTVGAASPRAAS